MLQQCFHVLHKDNDTSMQCFSLYLDVTDVLTAIFRNVLSVFKLFKQKCFFLILGQNVFDLPLLVTDFRLFCDLLNFNTKSNSYLAAQKDFGYYNFFG